MKELVISLSKVQKLKEELNILNKEYLKIYEEMEDLNKKKESLESIYMSKLGALIFLKFEKEIEYRKLKKKLNLLIQSKNKNEKIDINKIDDILKLELKSFYKELESIREKMNDSKIYLESPILNDEEVKKIKELFRKLAKKLHPDINKNLTKEEIELWNKIKEAYENNDLVSLIVLEGIIDNIEIKEDVSIDSIEENIEKIKNKIEKINIIIKESLNKFPLNLREVINNESFIQSKKDELNKEIKIYKEKINELNKLIYEVIGG
ncbi:MULTISPECIES: DnaJ domain-containing protein [Clostridium]|uniref:DnaJ domain-containing protein n=2 Tax=Clostridiaceae TaxID=31979 RepID=UPI000BE31ADD|nr:MULTISPECIES: DnaJ domain-containing protein [Clostridium]MBS5883685.1 DnaJ domain-containing protein [Clostridium sp.]MBU6135464.1 DnaJ domain-containing protein [Clostridium tertium]